MGLHVGCEGKDDSERKPKHTFKLPHQNNLQVKLRNDMPDDMLKDAIETSRRIIQSSTDFEVEGSNIVQLILMVYHFELKQM